MCLSRACVVLTFKQPEHLVPHAVQDIDPYFGCALYCELHLQIDASSVFADPQSSDKIRPDFDCDGIHPNVAGYQALFEQLDFSVFD